MMRERFKNYKTGKKMAVAFISIIILYIITVVTALFNIESVSSRMDRLYNEPFANVQSSLRMIANLRAVDRNIVLMAATDELVDEDRYLENTKELIQSEEAALTQLSTGYITAPEKVKELQEEFQKLAVSRTRIMSLLEEGKTGKS
ncbi:MCP four helix bundle domain-containing protein [Enterocloster citroniae]|uniref:MCP four helix bundle domain-containing protein n=1 Tax=Enterocloster citroniae TaxID=358743 RepID=UPI00349E5C45